MVRDRLLHIELSNCIDCPYLYEREVKGVYSCANAGWDRDRYPNVITLGAIPDPCPLPKIEPYIPLDQRSVIP